MTDTPPPPLKRPRFHVYLTPAEDPEGDPEYVGMVTVTNQDQLTAESQAKGLGIRAKDEPFHLTNLWIWCAMVRRGDTSDKFRPFTKVMEYRPVDDEDEDEATPDPTTTDPGVSTG